MSSEQQTFVLDRMRGWSRGIAIVSSTAVAFALPACGSSSHGEPDIKRGDFVCGPFEDNPLLKPTDLVPPTGVFVPGKSEATGAAANSKWRVILKFPSRTHSKYAFAAPDGKVRSARISETAPRSGDAMILNVGLGTGSLNAAGVEVVDLTRESALPTEVLKVYDEKNDKDSAGQYAEIPTC